MITLQYIYRKSLNLVGWILCLLLLPLTVQSQQLLSLDEVSAGMLLTAAGDAGQYRQLPTQSTDVSISVTGPLARTRLEQVFSNPGNEWMEAIYAFPLPEKAAVDRMKMQVGDRLIEAQVREKQQAKKVYTEAKKAGKKTALVEQHRPNLFTTSVANIPPGGEVVIRLEYQQPLKWQDQSFSLRFPMAITPRYVPASQLPATRKIEQTQMLGAGWSILPAEIPNAVPLNPAPAAVDPAPAAVDPSANTRIRVLLNSGFPVAEVSSHYHEINKIKKDTGVYEISLKAGAVRPDRDFQLSWKARDGQHPGAALFTETPDTWGDQEAAETWYGLLLVMPPQLPDAVPDVPRETVFVIDTSGSMGGESIRQARRALSLAIQRLDEKDSFNVVAFSSQTHRLFARSYRASQAHKQMALDYVAGLDAGGGTEMLPALQSALGMPGNALGALRQVVFITDGAVGNESELLAYIEQALGQSRLFTVGIGSAPNSYFMTEAAAFGRGSYTLIASPGEVNSKMDQLFRKIESPVLTQLALSSSQPIEMLPEKLPDLYAGEPISIALKSSSGALPEVTLSGRFGDTLWQQQLEFSATQPQSGLRVHWGREKIHQLMRSAIRGADAGQVRQQVIDVALQHHLVSRYTSLVAVDVTPARPAGSELNSHALPGMMPAGLQLQQPAMLASGATSSRAYLSGGLLLGLFSLAWMAWGNRRNRRIERMGQ